jgi:NitT/TauT family transport system substrate-binding protein
MQTPSRIRAHRRRWLAGTVAALVVLAACDAGDDDLDEVTLRLNWVVAGNHAPLFLAQSEGYWAECGLDVDIRAGSGSGDTAQQAGTGANEFGLTDAVSVAAGRVDGLPIRSFGVLYQENPSSVVTKADSGIEDLDDLEGRTFGAVPGGSPYLLLQWIFDQHDIDVDSIEEVSVPAPGIAQLQTDQVDFITFFGSEVVNVDENPEENLNWLWFSDLGVDTYGLAFAAADDYIDEHPDQVACFLEGAERGLVTAREDPNLALEALYEAEPETAEAPEVQEQMLEAMWELVDENDPFAQDQAIWERTQEILFEAEVIDEPVDASELFTDEFS